MWIRNTAGEKSASLTLVVVTFVIVIFWMIMSIFFSGPFGLAIIPFDASEAMVLLAPLLANYWGRRNTDAKTTLKSDNK